MTKGLSFSACLLLQTHLSSCVHQCFLGCFGFGAQCFLLVLSRFGSLDVASRSSCSLAIIFLKHYIKNLCEFHAHSMNLKGL